MPPGAGGGAPLTTFKIVPVPMEADFTTPENYFIKELVQATEKDKTVFYAVLGKVPDQKKVDLVGGVIDQRTAAALGKKAGKAKK